MAQKCSERRAVLMRVATLTNRLLLLNDEADRTARELTAAGVADVADTVDKILAAGGPVATDDTISKEIQSILDATTTDATNGVLNWSWEAE